MIYYVKNGGNDSLDGFSDATAWEHHPWMTGYTGSILLSAGDIVCMKRGDFWIFSNPMTHPFSAKQSGVSGTYIITTCYGTSPDLPLIKISSNTSEYVIYVNGQSYLTFDHLHIQHFNSSLLLGRDGIYVILSHNIKVRNCEIDQIPGHAILVQDSYNIFIGDENATHKATHTHYSNNIHDFGYAGIGFIGHDSSTGLSNYYATCNYIHDCTQATPFENAYGIYFSGVIGGYAKFNRVENILTWEGIESHGGTNLHYTDNYVKNCGRVGLMLGATPSGAFNNSIERNIVEQETWVKGDETAFIEISNIANSPATNLLVADNVCFYTTRPTISDFSTNRSFQFLTIASVIVGVVSRNRFYNGYGNAVKVTQQYTGDTVSDLIFKENYIDSDTGITINGPSVAGEIDILSNIIKANSPIKIDSGLLLLPNAVINIYGNTLVKDSIIGSYYNIYINGISSVGIVRIKNNIMCELTQRIYFYVFIDSALDGQLECDNNLYWNSSQPTLFYVNGSTFTWQQWQALGYDLNSLGPSVDPKFKKEKGYLLTGGYFDIESNSPTRNRGMNGKSSKDFRGILNPSDIGAFKYLEIPDSINVDFGIKKLQVDFQ
jgi:hypothetical protein